MAQCRHATREDHEGGPMNATSRKNSPNPHDLADLDSLLTKDEISVRSSVRELCARRIDPYVAEWFEAGEIPDIHGLARELGSLGLLGMHLLLSVASSVKW